jgi:hypothetical protein
MAMVRRVGIGVLLVLTVLAWAWWDGGREPLRPIEQPISVPEGMQ